MHTNGFGLFEKSNPPPHLSYSFLNIVYLQVEKKLQCRIWKGGWQYLPEGKKKNHRLDMAN